MVYLIKPSLSEYSKAAHQAARVAQQTISAEVSDLRELRPLLALTMVKGRSSPCQEPQASAWPDGGKEGNKRLTKAGNAIVSLAKPHLFKCLAIFDKAFSIS
jgi:hypothetical protein